MYEYQVIPAPTRAPKIKGMKAATDRFARSLTDLMNEAGAEGWEYVRTDTLPLEETKGLTRKSTTSFQNLMVFRRPLPGMTQDQTPPADAPEPAPFDVPELPQSRGLHPDPFAEIEPEPAEIVRQAPAPRVPSEDEMRARAESLRPAPLAGPAAAAAPSLRAGRVAPPPLRPLGGMTPDDR